MLIDHREVVDDLSYKGHALSDLIVNQYDPSGVGVVVTEGVNELLEMYEALKINVKEKMEQLHDVLYTSAANVSTWLFTCTITNKYSLEYGYFEVESLA